MSAEARPRVEDVMPPEALAEGEFMHALARELWPICRSITGPGVRETFSILARHLPDLQVHDVPTGTRCFDWTVPAEWTIRGAYIEDPSGKRIVDFADHNLHVVSYSAPFDGILQRSELDSHLFSLPSQPDVIPYVTSYYKEFWGFCLPDRQRSSLSEGSYRVVVDSELKAGSLTYADLVLPGETSDEILVSTYVCHPSMANNELSGPVLATALARWLASKPRRYTYRFVFVPETIGAICYLSRNLDVMRARTAAGFVLTCVGDERAWSFLPSREGDTLADRAAQHVLAQFAPTYDAYSFLQRGSDERQYCSPGIDLPVCSIMRSKYMTYPEYHTSRDDLELVTARGLGASLFMHQKLIETIEANVVPMATMLGEPMMSSRGLRPSVGKTGSALPTMTLMNLLAYADGKRDLIGIADLLGLSVVELAAAVATLSASGLIEGRPVTVGRAKVTI